MLARARSRTRAGSGALPRNPVVDAALQQILSLAHFRRQVLAGMRLRQFARQEPLLTIRAPLRRRRSPCGSAQKGLGDRQSPIGLAKLRQRIACVAKNNAHLHDLVVRLDQRTEAASLMHLPELYCRSIANPVLQRTRQTFEDDFFVHKGIFHDLLLQLQAACPKAANGAHLAWHLALAVTQRNNKERHRDINFEARRLVRPAHAGIFFARLAATSAATHDSHGMRPAPDRAFGRELYFRPWKRRPT